MKLFFCFQVFLPSLSLFEGRFHFISSPNRQDYIRAWLALGLELGEVGRSSRHHQQIGNVNCSKMAIAKNAKQEILDDLALYEIMRF